MNVKFENDRKHCALGVVHNCHHFNEPTQRTLGGRGSRAIVGEDGASWRTGQDDESALV